MKWKATAIAAAVALVLAVGALALALATRGGADTPTAVTTETPASVPLQTAPKPSGDNQAGDGKAGGP